MTWTPPRPIRSLALLAAALPSVALAQSDEPPPQDWTLMVAPNRKAVVATAQFDGSLTLIARCVNGVYDLIIHGLPEAPRRATTRELGLMAGEQTEWDITIWSVGRDRTDAFSRVPARVARVMAQGGTLQIVVPATPDQRRTRYVLEMDPSSTAIEQTLTACGRRLVDPREQDALGDGEDGLPSSLEWIQQPRIQFPQALAYSDFVQGYVVMSCVSQSDGRLDDCEVESEQPPGQALSDAVRAGLRRARVGWKAEDAATAAPPLAGRLVTFTSNFELR